MIYHKTNVQIEYLYINVHLKFSGINTIIIGE